MPPSVPYKTLLYIVSRHKINQNKTGVKTVQIAKQNKHRKISRLVAKMFTKWCPSKIKDYLYKFVQISLEALNKFSNENSMKQSVLRLLLTQTHVVADLKDCQFGTPGGPVNYTLLCLKIPLNAAKSEYSR